MKIINLFILSIILFSSCKQKAKTTESHFYKNLYTNEILNQSEFEVLSRKIVQDYCDSTPKESTINYKFYEKEISDDSIIHPFKYDLRIGNEYLVRANSYEKIGIKLTPKKLITVYGDTVQVGGKQSKPTFINLWFIHCPGCIDEIPALNKLKEEYADRVNFVALTFEENKEVLNFLQKRDFKFNHVAGVEYLIKQIGSYPYPENIFIDRNGVIRNIESGLGKTKILTWY